MKIHSIGRVAGTVLMTAALFLISMSAAFAQNTSIKGRWGLGVRGGVGVVTQDLADSVQGDLGPIVSGNIMYALEDSLLLGLNVEWETHQINVSSADLGDSTTISLLPFVELRGARMANITPYLSLGVGVNLNSFDLSSTGSAVFSKLDPPTTVALKIATGADFFITQNAALNAEIGWKYNSGDVDACSPFIGCGTDDWNLSVFSALLGLRYFF